MKCSICGCKDLVQYYKDNERGFIVYRCLECNHLENYADTESSTYIISTKQDQIDEFVALFKAKVVELMANLEKSITENKAKVDTLCVLSGESSLEDVQKYEHQPTYILDSIKDLPELLEK